jgi:hypothetical protein
MRGAGLLLLLLVGCGPAREPPAPVASGGPPAARPTGSPPVVADAPAAAPLDRNAAAAATGPGSGATAAAAAECLRRPGTAAVIRLLSATSDCSGVGHRHLVFEVLEARGGAALRQAYVSCPLYSRCAALDGPLAQPGAIAVARLRPDARPARTVACVAVPATDAVVACAVEVDGVADARRRLAATAR